MDPGGVGQVSRRGPLSPTLIYQLELKYSYQIQISAIDSTNSNSNNYYPSPILLPWSVLAFAKASAGENEAQLIII